MKRVVIISFLLCIIIGCFFNYSYGYDIWGAAKNWLSEGNDYRPSNMGNTEGFANLAGILWGAGVWIILISGTIMGIRFMISEPDKKAELKKDLVIYCVGSFIIFAALTIWNIAIAILDF